MEVNKKRAPGLDMVPLVRGVSLKESMGQLDIEGGGASEEESEEESESESESESEEERADGGGGGGAY